MPDAQMTKRETRNAQRFSYRPFVRSPLSVISDSDLWIRTNLLNPKRTRPASQRKQTKVFMIQNFKFALRQLLKAPGFTATAVLTLALAIGVNSAIFALINGVVLHPIVPLRPQEVVNVYNCRQNANHDYRAFSYNEFRELQQNGGDLFVDMAGLEFAVAGIGRNHEMRRSFVFLTSENYFSLMGAQPFRGRFYNAEECRPNANIAVVVASYGFWKRMGGRNDFVGSTLQINGQPYTVIGISPEGFCGASALIAPDIWLPLGVRSQLGSTLDDSESMRDLNSPKVYALNLVGRMRPGVTIESAKSRLPVISQRFNSMQGDGAEFQREVQVHAPSRFDLSTSPPDSDADHINRHFAHGDGGSGVAYRLFESRQHAARAWHDTSERNCASARARGLTLANHQAIARGRFAARDLWRRRRPRPQCVVQ